ncbi:hypothetical protein EHQ61_16300 [Leptospira wolffii]|uniref:hypothetical protein n=1 Tax=Leptospira wolffii TaxID=409998 RepID=UPI001084557A|nr:hypothetical protein [Leptospira wolffii]TGL46865.1 hypothetical protein EHQ61_16300 [Leptospira wolffii]
MPAQDSEKNNSVQSDYLQGIEINSLQDTPNNSANNKLAEEDLNRANLGDSFDIPKEVLLKGNCKNYLLAVLALRYIPKIKPSSSLTYLPKEYHLVIHGLANEFSKDIAYALMSSKLPNFKAHLIEALVRHSFGNIQFLFKIAQENGWSKELSEKFIELDENGASLCKLEIRKSKVSTSALSEVSFEDFESSKFVYLQSPNGKDRREFLFEKGGKNKLLFVSPRKLTVIQAYEEYITKGNEAKHYSDMNSEDLQDSSESLFICLNSIHKISPQNYKGCTLILDEIAPAIKQLYGNTMDKNRMAVLWNLIQISNESSKVIITSEQAAKEVFQFIEEGLKVNQYHQIIHELNPLDGKKIHLYESPDTLLIQIKSKIIVGSKVAIAFSSIESLRRFETKLQTFFPKKKIFEISSAVSSPDSYKKILQFSKDSSGFDILLFSSALLSGLNIERDAFQALFLNIDSDLGLTPGEACNILGMFSWLEEFRVYVINQPVYTSAAKQSENLVQDGSEETEKGPEELESQEMIQFANRFELHRKQVTQDLNFLRWDYRGKFVSECLNRGMHFEVPKSANNESALSGKNTYKGISNLLLDIRFAKWIDAKTASLLKKKDSLSHEEESSLYKYNLQHVAGFSEREIPAKNDLILALKRPRDLKALHSHVVNFVLPSVNLSELKRSDMLEGVDLHNLEKRQRILSVLKETWPIRKTPLKPFFLEDLTGFQKQVFSLSKDIEECFSVKLNTLESENPILLLSKVLGLIGLRLDSLSSPGQRTKYRINLSDFVFMARIAERVHRDVGKYILFS